MIKKRAFFVAFLLIVGSIASFEAPPLSAQQETWTGMVYLQEEGKGTIEFSLEAGHFSGRIVVRRGESTLETPIQGEWLKSDIAFQRTLSETTIQPFKGIVTTVDASHVRMKGEFAPSPELRGTWTCELERVQGESGKISPVPTTPPQGAAKRTMRPAQLVQKDKNIRADRASTFRPARIPDFQLYRTIEAPKERIAGAEDAAGYTHDFGLTGAFDFNPATNLLVAVIRDHNGPTRLFAFNMEAGTTIYKVIITDNEHVYIKSGKLSPDGRLFAVPTGEDRQITIWDPGSGARLGTGVVDGNAGDVDWHPSGTSLAVVAGKCVEIWEASSNSLVRKTIIRCARTETELPMGVGWSPDGNYLAIGTNSGAVYISNADGTHISATLSPRPNGVAYRVEWNSSGTQLVAEGFGTGSEASVWENPKSAYDSPYEIKYSLKCRYTPPYGQWWGRCTWDPAGKLVAFGDSQSNFYVYDVSTNALLKSFVPHPQSKNIIPHWKGEYLVTVGDYPDKNFKIWKVI